MIDYEGLMEKARKKARKKADFLYPFWMREEREKAYAELCFKYYRQYTKPNRR